MTEDNKQDTSFPSGGSRTEYIGAKVTVEQKQYIRRLAAEELGVKTSPYRFASTKEEFLELTRSKFGISSFDDMLDFAKKCKAYVPNVVLTVVDIIGEEKIEACRKITDEIGVTLRVRPFEE